jgi:hypothetical protein
MGGSAQAKYRVTPDLSCFGKGLGNGYPISVVGGRADLMKMLEKCFVSSTHGGDLVGIAAAIATLKKVIDKPVIPTILSAGDRIKAKFNAYARNIAISAGPEAAGVKCIGTPGRTRFEFPTPAHRSLFWQECLSKGVLFGHAQFTNFAMGQGEIDKTNQAITHGLNMLRKYWDDPAKYLKGDVAQETIRRVEERKDEVKSADTGGLPERAEVEEQESPVIEDSTPVVESISEQVLSGHGIQPDQSA